MTSPVFPARACGPLAPIRLEAPFRRPSSISRSTRSYADTPVAHASAPELRADDRPSNTPPRRACDAGRPATSTAEFVRSRLRLELDGKQQEILATEHYRLILNCTRQWGKSTVAAAKAVHRAWSRPGTLTLIVSPSERQSREFLRKAKDFVEMLRIPPRGDGDNPISLLFPNKSRIVGVPGKQARIRGFSAVSLLIIDEASWVSDEQYEAVQPMLATTDGDVWMMSTPWGQRGFFWREWTRGAADWFRVSVRADECPRIHPHYLERQKREMGEAVYRREYLCEFMGTGDAVFRREDLERAVTGEIRSLWS